MKTVLVGAAAMLLLGLTHELVAQNPPPVLEKKLHGVWKGTSACQGDLTLHANGTFARTHCGPGNNNFAGTWEVRWTGLPPVLVLTCKTSDDPAAVGRKEEMNLVELNDAALVIMYPPSDFRWQYAREKK